MTGKDKETSKARKFGDTLTDYRLRMAGKKNLTQNDIADQCDIPRDTYSKYEQGKFLPDMDRMLSLGEYLNIPPQELLSAAYPGHKDYIYRLDSFPCTLPKDLREEIFKSLSIETCTDDTERLKNLIKILVNYI